MKFVTLRICQALLARVLFLCHSLLAVGHTANVLANSYYWLLALANLLLVVETIYTVVKRKGEETRWICPSAVCYLSATVPAIILLELHRIEQHFNVHYNGTGLMSANMTEGGISQAPMSPIHWIEDKLGLSIEISPDLWVEVIEQLLLLLLIIGRWLMPKGKITRDQLSQLLFVYIAIASDIMELFELFEEKRVYENEALRYSIMIVWGISLTQFTLILTASRNPKKPRLGATSLGLETSTRETSMICCQEPYFEIFSLLTSLLIMDGPFLAIRLFVLISLRVLSYNILFFTSKNLLMVMLLLYRFGVILNDIRKKKHSSHEINIETPKTQKSVDQVCSMSGNNVKEAVELESHGVCVEKKVHSSSRSSPRSSSNGDDFVRFEKDDRGSTFQQRLSEDSTEANDKSKSLDSGEMVDSGELCLQQSNSIPECDKTESCGEQDNLQFREELC